MNGYPPARRKYSIACGAHCVVIGSDESPLTENPLRRARVGLAISQARVAAKFGILPQKLNSIEHDRLSDPDLELALADYYDAVAMERAIAKGVVTRGGDA